MAADFLRVTHNLHQSVNSWHQIERNVSTAMQAAEWTAAGVLATELARRVDVMGDRAETGFGSDPTLAAHVTPFLHGGQTFVGIPLGPEAEEAFEFEYGNEITAPQPVLRSTISGTYEAMSTFLSEDFQRRLFGAPGPH